MNLDAIEDFLAFDEEVRVHKIQRSAGGELASWLGFVADPEVVKAAGADPSDGMTHFVASTGAVDRMGDIVEQESWRLANYRRNPVIVFEHDPSKVVGRGVARVAGETGSKHLLQSVRWDDGDPAINPLGVLMSHQYRNGFRHAVSVGFIPGKAVSRKELPEEDPRRVGGDVPAWRAGFLFRFNELLETSPVGIPANAEALKLESFARAAEDPTEQVRRYLVETTPRVVRDALLDLIRRDPDVRRTIEAALWSTPITPNRPDGSLDAWLARGLPQETR